MAVPVVTATANKGSYTPGENITVSWTVVDADNATEELRLVGTDSQGNEVSLSLNITRQDLFTMDRVYWVRTNTNLTLNQAARTAAGTVPSA